MMTTFVSFMLEHLPCLKFHEVIWMTLTPIVQKDGILIHLLFKQIEAEEEHDQFILLALVNLLLSTPKRHTAYRPAISNR